MIGAVLALSALAACGSEPVSPLPAEAQSRSTPSLAPSPTTPATRAPSPRPPRVRPTVAPSPTPTPSSACLGAVVHTIAAETDLPFVTSICIAVGGVLRVEGTGPDTVSADPPDSVDLSYEAGIVNCRFLSPGSVTVSIVRDEQTYAIPVVVR